MDGVIGYITVFAGSYAPKGWALCQGQLLAIRQYTALFSIIGTYYGGDGVTTFGLPDLRGRIVIGAGTGPGLSTYDLGEAGGNNTASLKPGQMPAHTHPAQMNIVPGAAATANSTTPIDGVYASSSGGDLLFGAAPSGSTLPYPGTITTGDTGNNAPFSIQDPILAMNYVICLQGQFPSRN